MKYQRQFVLTSESGSIPFSVYGNDKEKLYSIKYRIKIVVLLSMTFFYRV